MNDCIFCKIADGRIKSDIVYRDEQAVAFRDIAPQAPVHIVVIPKQHIGRSEDPEALDAARPMMAAVNKIINEGLSGSNLKEEGYRLVVNSGKNGGQAVAHLHYHILGGRRMHWPPG